jgi:hypothetical protein
MITGIKTKPAIIAAIITGLTAIVFFTEAFFTPEEAESKLIRDYVISLNGENDFDSYTDPMYGFSISLPKDFIVSSFPQDEGEVIIAEHPTFNLGFEVFIPPFDEEGPLTADTIHQSVPSIIIEEPVETELDDGTAAVRFESDDPALGETRQIWFARDGNLFQVIMYSDNIEWLDAWARALPHDWTFGPPETALAL